MDAIWRRPQLRRDDETRAEFRPTWLELFFDLVFVVVVAELAHTLVKASGWGDIGRFLLLFVPAWWIWIGATYYNDRFGGDDVSHRLFLLLLMLPVAGLALTVSDATGEGGSWFAVSYVAARAVVIAAWVRAGWHNPPARPMTNRYAIGFTVSEVFWIASVFVPPPFRFVLWLAGLLVDHVTPVMTLGIQRRLPPLSRSHLPERFGLFAMIVLGESVAGVVRGAVEDHHFDPARLVTGVLAFGLAASFWWTYFDGVTERPAKRGPWWLLSWGYLHMPLLMALTALGAGVLRSVSEDEGLTTETRWLVCGATAAAFASLALLEVTLSQTRSRVVAIRLGAAAVALAVGFGGALLGAVPVLGALAVLGVAQVGQMIWDHVGGTATAHRAIDLT
jgi:low temperature requirement protein LtrA